MKALDEHFSPIACGRINSLESNTSGSTEAIVIRPPQAALVVSSSLFERHLLT